MSLLIEGMYMPKQTEVQTDKGILKLWTIRNWKVGQDSQFGTAKIPCDLSFNHDGTIHLSLLGKKYTLTDLEREYPKGTDFVITHRDSTEIDRIRNEAKEELINELKEMPLRDVLFTLYDDELDY